MRDPNKPDTQEDEYIADVRYAHRSRTDVADVEGVNPRDTSSMPRAEDDEQTFNGSVEYNDRTDIPDGGTVRLPIVGGDGDD